MSAPRPGPVRPIYRLSVIPGGAYSPAELMHALEADPVAAAHYAVFERQRLHTVSSPFSRPVYVSYRVGDAVYWTSHAIQLQPHETLLTDGNLFARARCGNRISLTPQQPVAQMEPLSTTLDTHESEINLPPSTARLLVADLAPPIPWEEISAETPVQPVIQPNPFPVQAGGLPTAGGAPWSVPTWETHNPFWPTTPTTPTVAAVTPGGSGVTVGTTPSTIPPTLTIAPPADEVSPPVPEPDTFVPLLLGLVILGGLRLRPTRTTSPRRRGDAEAQES